MTKENIRLEGKITAIEGGAPMGINLTIARNKKELERVNIPLHIKNSFEVVHYQLGWLGQKAKYEKKTFYFAEGGEIRYSLKLLSGPLKGAEYSMREDTY